MRFLLGLLLPGVMFLTIGRIFAGVVCLVLQFSSVFTAGIGWILASIWAIYALSQYKTDKKISGLQKQMASHGGGVPTSAQGEIQEAVSAFKFVVRQVSRLFEKIKP